MFSSFNLHGVLKTNLTHFNRETRESRTFDNSMAMTKVALRHQQELQTWERLMSLNAQSVADVNAFAVYLNVSQMNFPMTWRGRRMPSITDRFDLWHPTMTKHQTLHTGPVHYILYVLANKAIPSTHTLSYALTVSSHFTLTVWIPQEWQQQVWLRLSIIRVRPHTLKMKLNSLSNVSKRLCCNSCRVVEDDLCRYRHWY